MHVSNWQRGNGKQKDYPKQIPRPGIAPDPVRQIGGGKKRTIAEFEDYLARARAQLEEPTS